MAAALPFFQIAGAVVSAVGALRQGQASASAAEYNAQINQQNAQIARDNAAMQARQQDRENYLRLGAIRAAQGKSGGAAGEGSVLDVLADTAAQGELQKQDIIYQGELRARGFQNTANLDEYSASTARSGSYLRAGSELLSGAAGYYTTRDRLKRT